MRVWKLILVGWLLAALPALAASPELCIDKSASSTDSAATFSFSGCPVVFNRSDKTAYVTFYGDVATTSSSPVVAGGTFGVCVIKTKVVHVVMSGSDTGTVRVCNYGGTP